MSVHKKSDGLQYRVYAGSALLAKFFDEDEALHYAKNKYDNLRYMDAYIVQDLAKCGLTRITVRKGPGNIIYDTQPKIRKELENVQELRDTKAVDEEAGISGKRYWR